MPSSSANASSVSFVSCRQTTSGRRSSSHGRSRGTRCLIELTFQVASRTTLTLAPATRGGDARSRPCRSDQPCIAVSDGLQLRSPRTRGNVRGLRVVEGEREMELKKNAIGYASSVVIGVASTAPGYSLAAVLGLIVAVAGVGVHAPGVLIVSFVPMLLVALGYKYLNKAEPDAGTTFAWATRAFGPLTGWMGGWAIIVADLIVMANLAQIAGLYSFLLFGVEAPSTLAVTAVGVVWIAIMTAVCVIGVEVNARTQRWLLAAEIVTLAAFAVVALARVGAGAGALTPPLDWFSPAAAGSLGGLTSGLLVAVFISWGWDSLVCVNEETEDSETVPGKAAVMSLLILVGIYVIVATAAIAFGGVDRLA